MAIWYAFVRVWSRALCLRSRLGGARPGARFGSGLWPPGLLGAQMLWDPLGYPVGPGDAWLCLGLMCVLVPYWHAVCQVLPNQVIRVIRCMFCCSNVVSNFTSD